MAFRLTITGFMNPVAFGNDIIWYGWSFSIPRSFPLVDGRRGKGHFLDQFYNRQQSNISPFLDRRHLGKNVDVSCSLSQKVLKRSKKVTLIIRDWRLKISFTRSEEVAPPYLLHHAFVEDELYTWVIEPLVRQLHVKFSIRASDVFERFAAGRKEIAMIFCAAFCPPSLKFRVLYKPNITSLSLDDQLIGQR